MKTNKDSIINSIIASVEIVPGIISFSSLTPLDNSVIIGEEINKKSIEIEINEENIDVKLAIIISNDVSTKNLLTQIKESIFFSLKNNNNKLHNLNVYVKGVR
ncbi:MAG: hypothetical protein ACRCRZ_02870 [Metamycoplasmataceae bacterium]